MRTSGYNIKYKYTADECAEMIVASPAFAHITKEQILQYLKDTPVQLGRPIWTWEDELGNTYETGAYYRPSNAKCTTYYEAQEISNQLHEAFGVICRVCKEIHHSDGYEINRRLGWRMRDFLCDREGGNEIIWPPVCMACADSASATVWGGYQKAILYGVEKPTREQVELACCEWLADIVRKRILKVSREQKAA